MKLWLIEPVAEEDMPGDKNPWNPYWDKTFGAVIRAETEQEARQIAMTAKGDEVRYSGIGNVWLDPAWTNCAELTPDGEAGFVLVDSRPG